MGRVRPGRQAWITRLWRETAIVAALRHGWQIQDASIEMLRRLAYNMRMCRFSR